MPCIWFQVKSLFRPVVTWMLLIHVFCYYISACFCTVLTPAFRMNRIRWKKLQTFFCQDLKAHHVEVGGFNCIFKVNGLFSVFKGLFCLHNVWGLIWRGLFLYFKQSLWKREEIKAQRFRASSSQGFHQPQWYKKPGWDLLPQFPSADSAFHTWI